MWPRKTPSPTLGRFFGASPCTGKLIGALGRGLASRGIDAGSDASGEVVTGAKLRLTDTGAQVKWGTDSARWFWPTLAGLVVFVIALASYVRAQDEIDRAHERRFESFLLADELRHSSDDLTRMVRAFVTTGEPRFKRHYQEILDIRDGRIGRPVMPYNVYWDLVLEDEQRPRPFSSAVPLLELFRQTGFTDAEFAKLAEAKSASDALTQTEFTSMALAEAEQPTVDIARAEATRLLMDRAYHQTKARIMRPIAEFHEMVLERTLAEVQKAERHRTRARNVVLGSGIVLIGLLWGLSRSIYTQRRLKDETDARFRTVFDNAAVGLAEVTSEGRVVNINREFCRILALPETRILSEHFDIRQLACMRFELPSNGRVSAQRRLEVSCTRADGRSMWLDTYVYALPNETGGPDRHIVAAVDVTASAEAERELSKYRLNLEQLVKQRTMELSERNVELTEEIAARQRAVEALHETEQRFRFIAENTWDVIWILDVPSRTFKYVSPSVSRQRGYSAQEMTGQRLEAALTPSSAGRVTALLNDTVRDWQAGNRPETLLLTDLEQPHRDGHVIDTEVIATLHGDAAGNLTSILGVTRDVTERRRAEAAIRRLAFYDPLTHLPNRRLLADRLTQVIARARREHTRVALLFLDLDGFKPINDQHGHEVGDWLLQVVATRVVSCLREVDTAARVGGDEFVVLLPNLQEASDAELVRERIRSAVALPFLHDDAGVIHIGVSVGIACYPDDAENEQDLLRVGDHAMYRAKRAAKHSVRIPSCEMKAADLGIDLAAQSVPPTRAGVRPRSESDNTLQSDVGSPSGRIA